MQLKLKCSECGKELSLKTDTCVTEDGGVICFACVSKYVSCACGNYIHKKENRTICKSCDEKVYKRYLNNYSTKPIPRFKNYYTDNDKDVKCRYYGLELEFSHLSSRNVFNMLKPLYDDKWIYNKSDGSLSNGVEIVTNPLDRKQVNKLLDTVKPVFKMISKIENYDRNAGVHVHVSKNSVSPIDMYKLSYLLNSSLAKNVECKKFIYYLCGRINKGVLKEKVSIGNSDIFNDSYYLMGYTNGGIKSSIQLVKAPNNYDRHIAVNFCSKNTIEFRLFKSSADIDVIKSYIEIVDSLIDFCHTTPMKYININNFKYYLELNSKNKIILEKLEYLNKYVKLDRVQNTYSINACWSLLKGVNYTKYEEIIGGIQFAKTTDEIANIIQSVLNGTFVLPIRRPTTVAEKLIDKLEHTVKSVYINKIMKEVDKCA
jgi:hypothetical protein